MDILTHKDMYLPILRTLDRASDPIQGKVIASQIEKERQDWFALTDDKWEREQEKYDSGPTKFRNKVSWGLSYLKISGLLQTPKRGYYEITEKGREFLESSDGLLDFIAQKSKERREETQKRKTQGAVKSGAVPTQKATSSTDDWRSDLLDALQGISPAAFERLCKKLLEAAGLTQVELTDGPGDDGIDGRALIDMRGLVCVVVLFQCKRYTGSVAPRIVRDFRGAIGPEKGIIFTTGRFSDKAKAEAEKVGAAPIGLIDGELLIDKIKEFGLGVSAKTKKVTVEAVEIDRGWFGSL